MLTSRPIEVDERRWVARHLGERELALWSRMSAADQRHSIDVAHRFALLAPTADRVAIAASLLHDIGKLDSDLGVLMRVVATVVGPRTRRLRRYHDHERIGALMLREVGADQETIALVEATSADTATLAALRAADDI